MQEERRTALPIRTLLVDDDADFTRIFQISLRGEKRASFEVETAHTLASALQMPKEKTFRLIPLDLGVPYGQRFLWGQPA